MHYTNTWSNFLYPYLSSCFNPYSDLTKLYTFCPSPGTTQLSYLIYVGFLFQFLIKECSLDTNLVNHDIIMAR